MSARLALGLVWTACGLTLLALSIADGRERLDRCLASLDEVGADTWSTP